MTDTQATFFATLIDEWVRGGVKHAVVCPGNRSTLLSALLMADGRIEVHAVVDERSASFFALGIGKATGVPAVFWCTSGTAPAEAHAAVIEANQAGVPLIVATADRPPELHHVRDWQSVPQQNIYGDATRWSFDPGVADEAMRTSWRSIGARSVLEAKHHPLGPGPVHLNLPIREPWSLDVGEIPDGRADGLGWHVRETAEPVRGFNARQWRGRRGVVIVGEGSDPGEIFGFAREVGWPILADGRSGVRFNHPGNIQYFDELLRSKTFAETHKPDVILRFGAPLISKPLSVWARQSQAIEIVVDPFNRWVGSLQDATFITPGLAGDLSPQVDLGENPNVGEEWLASWRTANDAVKTAIEPLLFGDELTEPAVAAAVGRRATAKFAATSMPVRDLDNYGSVGDLSLVSANRGASGMDGIVSTAAGMAIASTTPRTLLIGDLTFLYDLNALWALSNESFDLDIVVVDNNGGGIFSTLPQLKEIERTTFEKVVATPHNANIARIVSGFGIDVVEIETMDELRKRFDQPLLGLRVIVVKTDRDRSAEVRAEIHAAAIAAIE